MSRALSWVIQVKPSPMVWKAQRSAKCVWIRSRSPVAMPPLMNCTTAQGMPWAMQRKIMPKAAELLPLPLPVWTMIRPRSSVLSAMIFSRAAAIFAIFAAWRAASSGGRSRSCGGSGELGEEEPGVVGARAPEAAVDGLAQAGGDVGEGGGVGLGEEVAGGGVFEIGGVDQVEMVAATASVVAAKAKM